MADRLSLDHTLKLLALLNKQNIGALNLGNSCDNWLLAKCLDNEIADWNSGKGDYLKEQIISSPEPSGSQGELIVYPCSVVRPSVVRPSVRRPPFSKIFSSETAWPIKAKFYMKHLWEGGINVYINNPGHMTKMAAMPIYGKNPSKIFFSGTTGPISTKLGMKH